MVSTVEPHLAALQFLHYKALKKLIKVCRNDRSRSVGPDQMEVNDRQFFKQLQVEVKAINRCDAVGLEEGQAQGVMTLL